MPLLRSINEYGIHLPMDVVITKGQGTMTILNPSDEEKAIIFAQSDLVTITPELAPEFEPE